MKSRTLDKSILKNLSFCSSIKLTTHEQYHNTRRNYAIFFLQSDKTIGHRNERYLTPRMYSLLLWDKKYPLTQYFWKRTEKMGNSQEINFTNTFKRKIQKSPRILNHNYVIWCKFLDNWLTEKLNSNYLYFFNILKLKKNDARD